MRATMRGRGVLRLALAIVCGLGLLAGPPGVGRPAERKTVKVGMLFGRAPNPEHVKALEDGLRRHGWVPGGNLVIESRVADGALERLPALAAELVALRVDAIVAVAGPETAAARQATRTIPIIFIVHGDPVGSGDVAGLARPGGNVTGLGQMAPEVAAKQLELLKQIVPKATRIAVLWNVANPTKASDWRAVKASAQALGVALQSREVRREADFAESFAAMRRDRPDALLTLVDPLTLAKRAAIVDFAAAARLHAMYPLRTFVDAGGLVSYGAELTDLFRRAARHVDKVLRGTKPADLPVEQATTFELVINLRAARAIGLEFPPSLRLRADQVIE